MWLNRTHGVDGVPGDAELDALLAAAGLAVVEGCRFTGRVREVYAAGLLGIRAGLAPGWVRWLKAHGLGHHLVHRGNHLYAEGKLHRWRQQEIEAELFAGELFSADLAGTPLTLEGLAAAAGVPVACVRSWQAASIYAHEFGFHRSTSRARDNRGPEGALARL
jgi:hypothetical protein